MSAEFYGIKRNLATMCVKECEKKYEDNEKNMKIIDYAQS